MGIQGLDTYMRRSAGSSHWMVPTDITTYKYIVVDLWNWFISGFEKVGRDRDGQVYGGDYILVANYVRAWVHAFRNIGIEPIFVFDGAFQLEKLNTYLQRREKDQSLMYRDHSMSFRSRNQEFPRIKNCLVYQTPIQQVFKELNVEHHKVRAEGDPHTFWLANQKEALVLSRDNDYYIFKNEGRTKLLHLDYLIGPDACMTTRLFNDKFTVSFTSTNIPLFDQQKFADFHDAPSQNMVALAILRGNDFSSSSNKAPLTLEIVRRYLCSTKDEVKKKFTKEDRLSEFTFVSRFYGMQPEFLVAWKYDGETPDVKLVSSHLELTQLQLKYFFKTGSGSFFPQFAGFTIAPVHLDVKECSPAWITTKPVRDKIFNLLGTPDDADEYVRQTGTHIWTKQKLQYELDPNSAKLQDLDRATTEKDKLRLFRQMFEHPKQCRTFQRGHLLAVALACFAKDSSQKNNIKHEIVDSVLYMFALLSSVSDKSRITAALRYASRRDYNAGPMKPDCRDTVQALADWNMFLHHFVAIGKLFDLQKLSVNAGGMPSDYYEGSILKIIWTERRRLQRSFDKVPRSALYYMIPDVNDIMGRPLNSQVHQTFVSLKSLTTSFYELWTNKPFLETSADDLDNLRDWRKSSRPRRCRGLSLSELVSAVDNLQLEQSTRQIHQDTIEKPTLKAPS